MGQRVEFSSNGHKCSGYLATPKSGSGPALVVIQEWWGLVKHIENVVDRFASEGFLTIAPDLFHGRATASPDEAQRLAMEMDVERAEKDVAGAGNYLLGLPACASKKWGVVGFCMGGGLAQYVASVERNVGAAVSFYGGFRKATIDWTHLSAPLLLIYAENDKGVPPEQGREDERKLKQLGKHVELKVYPGTNHAFFNETGKNYNAAAAADAFKVALEFFRQHIR
jgi:carboxymethylenebutenolidase